MFLCQNRSCGVKEVKEIYDPYLVSVDDGIMTLSFTDKDGAAFYLKYSLEECMLTDFGNIDYDLK